MRAIHTIPYNIIPYNTMRFFLKTFLKEPFEGTKRTPVHLVEALSLDDVALRRGPFFLEGFWPKEEVVRSLDGEWVEEVFGWVWVCFSGFGCVWWALCSLPGNLMAAKAAYSPSMSRPKNDARDVMPKIHSIILACCEVHIVVRKSRHHLAK